LAVSKSVVATEVGDAYIGDAYIGDAYIGDADADADADANEAVTNDRSSVPGFLSKEGGV
jgi:hypothetical protein